jgi:hypothetical protein
MGARFQAGIDALPVRLDATFDEYWIRANRAP